MGRKRKAEEDYINLAQIIPSDNLAFYLRVYHEMIPIVKWINDDYFTKEEDEFIKRSTARAGGPDAVQKIREDLEKNYQYGYADHLVSQCLVTLLYGKFDGNTPIKSKRDRAGWIDYSLNFLVHALIDDAKHYAKDKKPHYESVRQYLEKKGISTQFLNEDGLKQRYKSLTIEETGKNYFCFSLIGNYIKNNAKLVMEQNMPSIELLGDPPVPPKNGFMVDLARSIDEFQRVLFNKLIGVLSGSQVQS